MPVGCVLALTWVLWSNSTSLKHGGETTVSDSEGLLKCKFIDCTIGLSIRTPLPKDETTHPMLGQPYSLN